MPRSVSKATPDSCFVRLFNGKDLSFVQMQPVRSPNGKIVLIRVSRSFLEVNSNCFTVSFQHSNCITRLMLWPSPTENMDQSGIVTA